MNICIVTLILLIISNCSDIDISKFNGPIIFPLAESCCDTTMSSNGSFFYCSGTQTLEIIIFKNFGHSFEPFETISVPIRGCYIAISEKEDQVLYEADTHIFVFQRLNGTYQKVMQIDESSRFRRIQFVNEFVVTGLANRKINFYQ